MTRKPSPRQYMSVVRARSLTGLAIRRWRFVTIRRVAYEPIPPLVLYRTLAPLRDVPKYTRGIDHVCNTKSPRLHRGLSRWRHTELFRQLESIDMRPPCVEIVNHELHHEFLCPFLLKITLQYETTRTCVENSYVIIKDLIEA